MKPEATPEIQARRNHVFRTLSHATSLAFLLTSFASVAQPGEPAAGNTRSIESEILEINARMTDAADAQDLDSFFAYILDEHPGPIIQDGKLFASKAEARAAVDRASQGIARIKRTFRNPTVTVLSEATGLLTADGTVSATLDDGRTIVRDFAVSLVFVERDGSWKLLHGHYSVPNPAP